MVVRDESDISLDELKERFKEELEGVTNIEELKEIYAMEIARRDKLLAELQKQNQIILKSTFKGKKDELESKKQPL